MSISNCCWNASRLWSNAHLCADGTVLNDDAFLGADAEPLCCDAIDGRVWLLLGHVVARQEDVQVLHTVLGPGRRQVGLASVRVMQDSGSGCQWARAQHA